MSEEKAMYTAQELDELTLRCVICAQPIPASRARRRKDTCSIECYDKVKQWRRRLMFTRRCNSCLAPYTDKQRAEFKRWRQESGQLRLKSGRPPMREKHVKHALAACVQMLEANYTFIHDSEVDLVTGKIDDDVVEFDLKKMRTLINDCRKLLTEQPGIFVVPDKAKAQTGPREEPISADVSGPKSIDTLQPERDSSVAEQH